MLKRPTGCRRLLHEVDPHFMPHQAYGSDTDDVAGKLQFHHQRAALAWLRKRCRQGRSCDQQSCKEGFWAHTFVHIRIRAWVWVQYVFALTQGEGFTIGGELWRSDSYGAASSWKNLTGDLEGTLLPACWWSWLASCCQGLDT